MDIIPQTAKEALERWDAGQSVFSVAMGGLGPGYEQAIQIAIFEIIRDCLEARFSPLTKDETERAAFSYLADQAVSRADKAVHGFSGAQVGAAKSVAWNVLAQGWRRALEQLPKDRLIQVSRTWPQPPVVS